MPKIFAECDASLTIVKPSGSGTESPPFCCMWFLSLVGRRPSLPHCPKQQERYRFGLGTRQRPRAFKALAIGMTGKLLPTTLHLVCTNTGRLNRVVGENSFFLCEPKPNVCLTNERMSRVKAFEQSCRHMEIIQLQPVPALPYDLHSRNPAST